MQRRVSRVACLLFFVLAACTRQPTPAAAPRKSASDALPSSPASGDPQSASVFHEELPVSGAATAPTRARKPLPIHNSCAEPVTLAFGDDPNAPGAGRRIIGPYASIEGPRDADGRQTVWLLGDKGDVLVKVSLTRGMKTLEIGRSCRSLDAR